MCSLLQWGMVSVTMRQILARCQYYGQGTSSHCPKHTNVGPPYPLTRYCINVITAVWWLQSTKVQLGTQLSWTSFVAFVFSFPTTILNNLLCEHIAGMVNNAADHLPRYTITLHYFHESNCLIGANSSIAGDHQHPRTGLDFSTLSQLFIPTINKI